FCAACITKSNNVFVSTNTNSSYCFHGNESSQPTTQPLPTKVSIQSVTHSCLKSAYISLGEGWTSPDLLSPYGFKGETRIYSHCPPSPSVIYNSIVVDDLLKDVRKVCKQSDTSVWNYFESLSMEDKKLTHYKSSPINLAPDCRIDFHIQDDAGKGGDNMGMMIKSSSPNPCPPTSPSCAASTSAVTSSSAQ
ncbi:MAG: hypothetical protein Greene041614_1233, partial [Parcubacteria group bacterium Greene0416_14]